MARRDLGPARGRQRRAKGVSPAESNGGSPAAALRADGLYGPRLPASAICAAGAGSGRRSDESVFSFACAPGDQQRGSDDQEEGSDDQGGLIRTALRHVPAPGDQVISMYAPGFDNVPITAAGGGNDKWQMQNFKCGRWRMGSFLRLGRSCASYSRRVRWGFPGVCDAGVGPLFA